MVVCRVQASLIAYVTYPSCIAITFVLSRHIKVLTCASCAACMHLLLHKLHPRRAEMGAVAAIYVETVVEPTQKLFFKALSVQ